MDKAVYVEAGWAPAGDRRIFDEVLEDLRRRYDYLLWTGDRRLDPGLVDVNLGVVDTSMLPVYETVTSATATRTRNAAFPSTPRP